MARGVDHRVECPGGQHDRLEARPCEARDVAEGEDVGKVPVDGGGGDDGDSWRGVNANVVVRAGVIDGAYETEMLWMRAWRELSVTSSWKDLVSLATNTSLPKRQR